MFLWHLDFNYWMIKIQYLMIFKCFNSSEDYFHVVLGSKEQLR